ncbi:MAG: acyltransferase family protein [Sphingorhabdus sp.]
MSSPKYRKEIDGLRSIAVIPVVLFHSGFSSFSGGYVGVDVFFVISGYLITSLIQSALEEGKFSLWEFYERRARRLLPALMLMILCCIPFAWLWMLPSEFKDFSKSIIATNLYVSNFVFWQEAGYFGTQSELKPLLHTWSLAIEEQFYLFFPLCLLLLSFLKPKALISVILLFTALSLAMSEWGTRNYPVATFYLLPTRAWELGFGALIALFGATDFKIKLNGLAREMLGGFGLILIFISVFTFDQGTPFPSPYGLVPAVGTALVITFATGQTATAKLLRFPLLVGVGLISYSAYLWHQPLLAFANLRIYGDELWLTLRILLIFSTFLIAYLSWRFVEQPFRNREFLTRKKLFFYAAIGTMGLVSVGVFGVLKSDDFAPAIPQSAAIASTKASEIWVCKQTETLAPSKQQTCRIGSRKVKATIAVLGDSHAGSSLPGLDKELKKSGQAAIVFFDNWCAPLYNFGTTNPRKNIACRKKMSDGLEYATGNRDIKTVVLIAQWPNYLHGLRWDDYYLTAYDDGTMPNEDPSRNNFFFKSALQKTTDLLSERGKQLIIFGTVPEYKMDVPKSLARDAKFGSKKAEQKMLNNVKANYLARNSRILETFRTIDSGTTTFVDTFDLFCDSQSCKVKSDETGEIYYRDSNHLSASGSEILARALTDVLDTLSLQKDLAKEK